MGFTNNLMAWENNYDVPFSEKEDKSIYKALKYIRRKLVVKTPRY